MEAPARRRSIAVVLALLMTGLAWPAPAAASESDCTGTTYSTQDLGAAYAAACGGVFGYNHVPGQAHEYVWRVWRDWYVDVTLEITEGEGTVRIERHAGGSLREVTTTSASATLDAPLVGIVSRHDQRVQETVRVVLVDKLSVSLRYTLHFHLIERPGTDCVGRDTTGSAPGELTWGEWCHGRLVDGWNSGFGDKQDFYVLRGLTDGDVVTFSLEAAGRSYHRWGGGPSAWVSPDRVGGSASRVWTTVVGPNTTQFTLGIEPWQPTKVYQTTCYPAWGCKTELIDQYDPYSVAPFVYAFKADVVPNTRPEMTYERPPVRHFAGDPVVVEATMTDADDDELFPSVKWGHNGEPFQMQPPSGPSGTRFVATFPAAANEAMTTVRTHHIYVSGKDAPGASAWLSTSLGPRFEAGFSVHVAPADCEPMAGDAPPEGRAFDDACVGWVGLGWDEEDVLLRHVAAGERLMLAMDRPGYDAGGNRQVAWSVTDPAGVVRDAVDHQYVAYAETAGTYAVRILPLVNAGSTTPYRLQAATEVIPPPEGILRVEQVGTALVGAPAALGVTNEESDTLDLDVTIDWGDDSPPTQVTARFREPLVVPHTYGEFGLREVSVTASARGSDATYATQLMVPVMAAGDCGEPSDAPEEGRLFHGVCEGWVGEGVDEEDVLLADVPAGYPVRFTVEGPVLATLRSPDGVERVVDEAGIVLEGSMGGVHAFTVRPASGEPDATYVTRVALMEGPPVEQRFDFRRTPGGFEHERVDVLGVVVWDPLRQRVQLESNRLESGQTVLSRPLGDTWTPESGSFTVTASWTMWNAGVFGSTDHRRHMFPLVLAPEGPVDVGGPGVAFVQFLGSGLGHEHRLRFRDAAGVLRIDEPFPVASTQERLLSIGYDASARTLWMETRTPAGALLARGETALSAGEADAFAFAKVAMASGTGTGAWSWATPAWGWVDQVDIAHRPHPGAPTAITATSGPGVGEVTLSWAPPPVAAPGATLTYQVLRGDAPHRLQPVAVVQGVGNVTWLDSSAMLHAMNHYRVEVVDAQAASARSAEACALAGGVTFVTVRFTHPECGR